MLASLVHLKEIQSSLEAEDIDVCFLGDIALNYYNVDRVIADVEICVPEAKLEKAKDVLISSSTDHTKARIYSSNPWSHEEDNIFTSYKVHHPRIRCQIRGLSGKTNDSNPNNSIHICILPDSLFYMWPLSGTKIPKEAYGQPFEYSNHMKDVMTSTERDIHTLNLPRLSVLFGAFLRKFVESSSTDYNFAMLAENLIDGMNLDNEWCERHIPQERFQELAFAKELVATKSGRLPYYPADSITAFIPTSAEAERLARVPGRDL